MKALVYTNPNEVTYRDEPDPTLAAGEVVLRIDAVGICGSDMHAYHGHDPRRNPPLILGHELSGTASSACRAATTFARSEEHTSELQSPDHLVCRLLLEKKKK